jgi:hypothetical protein
LADGKEVDGSSGRHSISQASKPDGVVRSVRLNPVLHRAGQPIVFCESDIRLSDRSKPRSDSPIMYGIRQSDIGDIPIVR